MQIERKSYKSMTDEALMRSISNGEKLAFDEIYNRYSAVLCAYFTRMLWKDREKAEDFVHDFFAKIIRKPEYFDPTRAFKTWMYSVANNMCKNEYKKQEIRKNTSNGLDTHYTVADESTNLFRQVQELQFKERYDHIFQTLDPKHSEAFQLRHVEGLSIKEIAEIVGANEGTIKSRIFYATKYLADGLKEFNPAEKE